MTDSESTARGRDGFRLGQVLRKRMKKEGSYAALARAITRANEQGPSSGRKTDALDRRKLKSLVEGGKGAVLTIDDLYALDHYLERFGEGLASRPLLQKPDLMQALAGSGRVTFLIGSKPEDERAVVSHWDVLAMAEVQRAIGRSEVGVSFDIQTVPLHPHFSATRKALEAHEALVLLEDNGPSLVCLGSARSNPFAELMLCRMLGYPAFGGEPLPPRAKPPFHLIWNPGLQYLCPSHFHLEPQALRSRDRNAAELVAGRQASALATPERVRIDRVTPRKWGETYGICLAQRRRRGQVWLLLLGVTGAATFVAAKLANRLATRLNESLQGQNSDIYWGIVEARVERGQQDELFNLREFAGQEIMTQPPIPAPDPV